MLGTTGVKRASAWQTVQDTAEDYGVDVSDRVPKEYGGTWEPLKDQVKQKAGGAPAGMVRFQDSRGGVHDIPSGNLKKARKRDPGLKVIGQ